MFELNTKGATQTNSPLTAFILAKFRGQRVINRWQRPLFTCGFFTFYIVRFELVPASFQI